MNPVQEATELKGLRPYESKEQLGTPYVRDDLIIPTALEVARLQGENARLRNALNVTKYNITYATTSPHTKEELQRYLLWVLDGLRKFNLLD